MYEPEVVEDSKETVVFQTQQDWCTYEHTETVTARTPTGTSSNHTQSQLGEAEVDTKSHP